MADEREQEQTDQQEEDLEVSEEQAEQIEGGSARARIGADRDPQGTKTTF
jgi:hypothetical protein